MRQEITKTSKVLFKKIKEDKLGMQTHLNASGTASTWRTVEWGGKGSF